MKAKTNIQNLIEYLENIKNQGGDIVEISLELETREVMPYDKEYSKYTKQGKPTGLIFINATIYNPCDTQTASNSAKKSN